MIRTELGNPMNPATAATGGEARPWLAFGPALALLVGSAALILGLSVRLPEAGSQAALVFSPGTSRDQALQTLRDFDARLVRSGGFDNILVAYFERPVGWAELRERGVLLPLDPLMAGGCASVS
jgi:hypothetical protein